MEPDNREIFAALIGLLEQLSATEINRAISAAGYQSERPHHNSQEALNELRLKFDAEHTVFEEKAIVSLRNIAKQLAKDVGVKRVEEALGTRGIQWLDADFVRPDDHEITPDPMQHETSVTSTTVEVGLSGTGKVSGGVGAQILPSLTQHGTDIPDHKNKLTGPDAVPISKVRVEYETSLLGLLQLRNTLDQFHGDDAPEKSRNTQEVPLSEDDLTLLRAVVGSAIALHDTPNITTKIRQTLNNLCDILGDLKKLIDKLAAKFDSLQMLAVKIGTAYLAFRELLDIVGGSL